ncbi:MAG: hypothetical protein HY815_06660 [Candidatus Riflebacteria bacterium]|nr:hypothetical protein [Candidatus Riflebacteria bacterium]
MARDRLSTATIAVIVGIAVGLFLHVAVALLLATPEVRVQYVPDDAYYTIGLARNFCTQGRWTFDSGTSVTTGFHRLHVFVMTGIYRLLKPEAERFVVLSIVYSWALLLPVLVIATVFTLRAGRLSIALLLFLFLVSRNVLLNSVCALEWTWVVLVATLTCVSFRVEARPDSRRFLIWVFALGFAGSLARTDFGLLPLAVTLATILESPAVRSLLLPRALAGLVGATAGLATVTLHNHLVSGRLLQSSAAMKLHWGSMFGGDIPEVFFKMLSLLGPPAGLRLVLAVPVVAAPIALGAWFYLRDRFGPGVPGSDPGESADATGRVLWLACLVTVIGYVLLYSRVPFTVQNWYTGNVIVPLFLVLSLPYARSYGRRYRALVALPFLAVSCFFQAGQACSFLETPEWPHQLQSYRAGLYLRDAGLGVVGSWNAGVVGYYEGGHVVNLDGLVNDDIHDYVTRQALPAYLEEREIRVLVDSASMLDNRSLRARGGYDDARFLSRVRPLRTFGSGTDFWKAWTLYEVSPDPRRGQRVGPGVAGPAPSR